MSPHLATSVAELNEVLELVRAQSQRVAFVPTMGALHRGHLELVRAARQHADVVVVSIFVNPTQFSAGEDFDRYPRTVEQDIDALEGLAEIVFAPTAAEVYPPEGVPQYSAGEVGTLFEGQARPGHFDGMLTVVARLFELVRPDVAVFGQKDAQQVFLVRRHIQQERLPLELIVVPTVREPDGLALSSRNVFLSESERQAATVLSRALAVVSERAASSDVKTLRQAGIHECESEPLVRLEYLELVDPTTFHPVPQNYEGPATAIIAAKLGNTRLIDTENLEIVHA